MVKGWKKNYGGWKSKSADIMLALMVITSRYKASCKQEKKNYTSKHTYLIDRQTLCMNEWMTL